MCRFFSNLVLSFLQAKPSPVWRRCFVWTRCTDKCVFLETTIQSASCKPNLSQVTRLEPQSCFIFLSLFHSYLYFNCIFFFFFTSGVNPSSLMNLFTYEKGFCFVSYLSQLCGDIKRFDTFLKVNAVRAPCLNRSEV